MMRVVSAAENFRIYNQSAVAVPAGDQAIARNYGLCFSGSRFYYQPTFQTSPQQYSPGVCLLSKMVEEACDDSAIRWIDLGLGAEGYKKSFGNGVFRTLRCLLGHFGRQVPERADSVSSGQRGQVCAPARKWIRSLLEQAS